MMTLWQNPYVVKSQSQSQFLRDSGVSVSISVLKIGFLLSQSQSQSRKWGVLILTLNLSLTNWELKVSISISISKSYSRLSLGQMIIKNDVWNILGALSPSNTEKNLDHERFMPLFWYEQHVARQHWKNPLPKYQMWNTIALSDFFQRLSFLSTNSMAAHLSSSLSPLKDTCLTCFEGRVYIMSQL